MRVISTETFAAIKISNAEYIFIRVYIFVSSKMIPVRPRVRLQARHIWGCESNVKHGSNMGLLCGGREIDANSCRAFGLKVCTDDISFLTHVEAARYMYITA